MDTILYRLPNIAPHDTDSFQLFGILQIPYQETRAFFAYITQGLRKRSMTQ
ncbi:hypothetical protein [Desulfospira joergensenii]|uniref:hypothetical protein n=1 Tax=Desulfospira joergensenii TaxID=53329 RepID=UPI00129479A7|nr:hypothetical protein [Desulfospira joergensenii]